MRVYGPVPSRRFGLSLGVDPLPAKTCCYDCVYCQQGRTTSLTCERADLVPLDEILEDVRDALASGPDPQVVTLAGSGEPTLYLSLEDLVVELRRIARRPVVLLTNGALLSDPAVRRAAALADVVSPDLDAADAETFGAVNRPHPDIGFERMVEGLRALREETTGAYDLEVFLARGVNDSEDHVERLAALARSIRADSIRLNTAVRPVPGREGLALDQERMERIAPLFGPTAGIVASFTPGCDHRPGASRDILGVLERRPCTAEDLASSLGIAAEEAILILEGLERSGLVERAERGFWRAK